MRCSLFDENILKHMTSWHVAFEMFQMRTAPTARCPPSCVRDMLAPQGRNSLWKWLSVKLKSNQTNNKLKNSTIELKFCDQEQCPIEMKLTAFRADFRFFFKFSSFFFQIFVTCNLHICIFCKRRIGIQWNRGKWRRSRSPFAKILCVSEVTTTKKNI